MLCVKINHHTQQAVSSVNDDNKTVLVWFEEEGWEWPDHSEDISMGLSSANTFDLSLPFYATGKSFTGAEPEVIFNMGMSELESSTAFE